jgi:hypothetical protein
MLETNGGISQCEMTVFSLGCSDVMNDIIQDILPRTLVYVFVSRMFVGTSSLFSSKFKTLQICNGSCGFLG